jgi:hypothetical protein
VALQGGKAAGRGPRGQRGYDEGGDHALRRPDLRGTVRFRFEVLARDHSSRADRLSASGWEFSINGYDFGSVFAPDSLRIEFIHLGSKELAEALELALLEEYRWRFKDRPPLNGSAGKYRKVRQWLEQQGRAARDIDGWIDLSGLLPLSAGPSSPRGR